MKKRSNSNLAFKKMIKSYINECLREVVSDFSFKLMIKEIIRESISDSVEQVLEQKQASKSQQSKTRQKSRMSLNEYATGDAEAEDIVNNEEEFLNKRRQLLEMQFSNGPSSNSRKSDNREGGFNYASIFEDTLKSGHPLITGEDSGVDATESPGAYDATSGVEIPDTVLEEAGLLDKDWSRHIGLDD